MDIFKLLILQTVNNKLAKGFMPIEFLQDMPMAAVNGLRFFLGQESVAVNVFVQIAAYSAKTAAENGFNSSNTPDFYFPIARYGNGILKYTQGSPDKSLSVILSFWGAGQICKSGNAFTNISTILTLDEYLKQITSQSFLNCIMNPVTIDYYDIILRKLAVNPRPLVADPRFAGKVVFITGKSIVITVIIIVVARKFIKRILPNAKKYSKKFVLKSRELLKKGGKKLLNLRRYPLKYLLKFNIISC